MKLEIEAASLDAETIGSDGRKVAALSDSISAFFTEVFSEHPELDHLDARLVNGTDEPGVSLVRTLVIKRIDTKLTITWTMAVQKEQLQ